ncbi:L,D-transpeptidase family protein [Sphingomonas xanthus]|uniref:L,D-transpeptidase family protein n=2 Tax=Sphingomonas xanthus TaxID=2594473 RepID=A0A516IS17_9SPHN|nr:L,D-transpeptidase family protein [Sphingomonas xanthus]
MVAALPLYGALAQNADPIAPLPEGTAVSEPAPALVWQVPQAQALLNYIYNVSREGLAPADYDPDGLLRAIAGGDPMAMSAAATDRFNRLSSDLALGHVRGEARIDWHIVDRDLDETRQRQLLAYALGSNKLAEALDGLLPTHPQYGALKHALQVTPRSEIDKVNKIRLNMDRWRWLPRDLGQKYIIVNVPAFYATLVEDGTTRWKQRAVAGAIKTPTPQLTAMATGVILNPWWEVPRSIAPEVAGKPGYVAVKGKDGKVQRWRQPPGPSNALGQMKFVMPNEHAIYLHDTNARSRFNSQIRALSHGCVRTQNIHDLAAELGSDGGGEWTRARIDEVLASKKTVEAKFVTPVPVHIVYFSVAALNDGTIVAYNDLYKRDAKVIEALLDKKGLAPATPATRVASN